MRSTVSESAFFATQAEMSAALKAPLVMAGNEGSKSLAPFERIFISVPRLMPSFSATCLGDKSSRLMLEHRSRLRLGAVLILARPDALKYEWVGLGRLHGMPNTEVSVVDGLGSELRLQSQP